MSIEKEILKLYEELNSSKKLIKEVTDVYDNVDFKDRVVGSSTPSKDNINTALLSDIQTAAKNAGVTVDITTAITGHGEKTKSGNTSRHPSGNAVDIAIVNGKAVSTSTKPTVEKFVDELVKLGYVKNSESGNPKAVLTYGFPGHDNHIHISNTTGSPSTSDSSTSNSSEDAYKAATSDQTSTTSTNSQYASVVGNVSSSQNFNENEDRDIENILNLYESILNKTNINEVSSASDELFGGGDVRIPSDGAHAGQSGWQSSNAWDIKAPVGAPVYALADGVAQTFRDYGKNVTKTEGKKLYGQSFTVKSDGGLPSIYYTHLEGSPVQKGSTIKCGQFLGYIMDFPGSSYDHVHIGVERGNIRQFLNDDGTLKCAKGQKISGGEIGDSPSSSASEDAYNYATSDQTSTTTSKPQYAAVVGNITSAQGLQEQSNFGKNVSNRYGRVIIPKDDNSKIKAPVSGKINNKKYFSSCKNQVTIENNDNGTIYLQFCGISNPLVSDGQRVSVGTVLGKTDNDVEVLMYDGRWNRINIPDKDLKIDKKDTETIDDKKKKSSEPEYWDPFTAAIFGAPSRLFQDKYDESGKRIEKRYGGVADKKDVDPWVLNFLKDPFKRKKVNESIERIKKML